MRKNKKYSPKSSFSNRRNRFSLPKNPGIGFVQVGTCKIRHGVSKIEGEWLDRLSITERSKAIRGFNNKIMIVDGYDPKTRTAMEFLGATIHGCHRIPCKNRDLPNTWLKKTPNQLYNETVYRFERLFELGFKIFFVWEDEYKKGKTMGRYFRGKGDNLY